MTPKRILVTPEFNEEKTVVDVLAAAAPYVDRIVVIDDGSWDESHRLISAWMRDAPVTVDLLRHQANAGMSGALLSGFAFVHHLMLVGEVAAEDIVINIDCDGQHDPAEIPVLVDYLVERGVDVALGRRHLEGYPAYKLVGNFLLSLWASLLSGYRYRDVECGLRAMRARVLGGLLQYFAGYRYGCAQEIGVILPRMGFLVDNRLPVSVRYYRQGARFRDGIVNFWMGFRTTVRTLLKRSRDSGDRAEHLLAGVDISSNYATESRRREAPL